MTVSLARAAVRAPAHNATAEIHAVWVSGYLSEQLHPPLNAGDLAIAGFVDEPDRYVAELAGAQQRLQREGR